MAAPLPVALFIDPPTHHFDGDRFFDAETPRLTGAHILEPYAALREWFGARGVAVRTAGAWWDSCGAS